MAEAILAHTFLRKTIKVEFGYDELGAVAESFGLSDQRAVFVNQGMPVPGEIGSRFPGSGGDIEIGRKTAGGLVRGQRVAVFVLADGDIGGGKIQDHRGAR